MNSDRDKRGTASPGFNVGSASIIMVFAVLCLTIFAVLSLITTTADIRLSRRAASAIKDYYAAEYEAESMVIEISKRLSGAGSPGDLLKGLDVTVFTDKQPVTIGFAQPVDRMRELSVLLAYGEDNELTIVQWKLSAVGEWNPDAGIGVFIG